MIGFIAIGVAGISLLSNIIGLAIPYWVYDRTSAVSLGLWQSCVSDGGGMVCTSYGFSFDRFSWILHVVRACEIIGMILIMATLVCYVLKLFVTKDKEMLPQIGASLAIAAGMLMIIGCIVFAIIVLLGGVELRLHAGFSLCIVGGVAAFVAAVLGFMIKRSKKVVPVSC